VLATLHLPPDWYPAQIFSKRSSTLHLNCVSKTQKHACSFARVPLPVIPNGIDVDRFRFRKQKKGYVLSLGRICPEKGFHRAIRASRLAGREFRLAGELINFGLHLNYFEKKIAPRLNSKCKFLGSADFSKKRKLLSNAACLLIPSLVAETSSLVAMEALASGTPVIASRVGALPEIVEHGVTGFIVDDEREMADAIRCASEIRPEDCRAAAEERFSARAMAKRYLAHYVRLIEEPRQLPRRRTAVAISARAGDGSRRLSALTSSM
jgi:glycosyltransferase involved in cell wall biosynthesis